MPAPTVKIYDAIRRARRLLPASARPALASATAQDLWTLAILLALMVDQPVDLGLLATPAIRAKVKPLAPSIPGVVSGARLAAGAVDDAGLWAAASAMAAGVVEVGPGKIAGILADPSFGTARGYVLDALAVPTVVDPPLPAAAEAPAPAAAPAPPAPEAPAPAPPAAAPKKPAPPRVKLPGPKAAPPADAAEAPAEASTAAEPAPPMAIPDVQLPGGIYTLSPEEADRIVAEAMAATVPPPSPDLEVIGKDDVYTGPGTVAERDAAPAAKAAEGWTVQAPAGKVAAPPKVVQRPAPRRPAPVLEVPAAPPGEGPSTLAIGLGVGGAVLFLVALVAATRTAPAEVPKGRDRGGR